MGLSEKISKTVGVAEERVGTIAGSKRLVSAGRDQQVGADERGERKDAARALRRKAKKTEKKARRLAKGSKSRPGKKTEKKIAKLQKKVRKLQKKAKKV